MTVRSVSVWPHQSLKAVAEDVEDVRTEEVQSLIQDLRDTLAAYNAHGLAATQVDVPRRIIVVQDSTTNFVRVLVNPVYLPTQETPKVINSFEGCLSFPGVKARIKRKNAVRLAYLDENGNAQNWNPTGLEAVAIQHEIDHLNGVTMLDHLSRLETRIALRRLKKVKKRLGAYA